MVFILIILSGIGGIFCLSLAIACILAVSRENVLPDIEDVDLLTKT
jgi:hypothetical protein